MSPDGITNRDRACGRHQLQLPLSSSPYVSLALAPSRSCPMDGANPAPGCDGPALLRKAWLE